MKKKTIRITESQLKEMVKNVISEMVYTGMDEFSTDNRQFGPYGMGQEKRDEIQKMRNNKPMKEGFDDDDDDYHYPTRAELGFDPGEQYWRTEFGNGR